MYIVYRIGFVVAFIPPYGFLVMLATLYKTITEEAKRGREEKKKVEAEKA